MTETGRAETWRVWVGRLGAMALGGVLLVAALAKAVDPVAFAEAIEAEGLAGWMPAGGIALVAIGLEAGLGVLLISWVRRLWVLVPTTALVGFFLFLTGRAYWMAAHGDPAEPASSCGCFGNLVDRTPAEAFWQDLFLLGIPLLLAFVGREPGSGVPRWRIGLAGTVTVGAVLLAWKAPELPLDDVATRLRPGTRVDELCAGTDRRVCLQDLAPSLQEGEHWVVMVDPERSPEEWVQGLNRRIWAAEGPPLTVLADATPEELMEIQFTLGPAFPIHEAPSILLRPLYRELPRSFLVRDGTVVVTSSGLPPESPGPTNDNDGDPS